jgi:hypothetical protein
MIIDDKEVNAKTAYKAGYDDSLNGKPCDSAAIYGALSGHYSAGYATGRMKARAGSRRAATQHSPHETL